MNDLPVRGLSRRLRTSPLRIAAAVAGTGLLLTLLSTYATARVDFSTEQRLLQTQTRQAATVLSSAIGLIREPLTSSLAIQEISGRNARSFASAIDPHLGEGKEFVAASLWERSGEEFEEIARRGVRQALTPGGAALETILSDAVRAPTYVVRYLTVDGRVRIGFAEASPDKSYVVYAERAVPADGRTPSDRNSAFVGLRYATYLGPRVADEALVTTDLPREELPLMGESTYRTSIPFGDDQLIMVATPRSHLGGSLNRDLPFILLGAGLLLTALAARLVYQVVGGRQAAETAAETIASLYQRVDAMYAEQRDVSVRLQRALLPSSNPEVPGLETASEYVAGAQGVDIGGDWFSVVRLDAERFAFVVGDVSGHGIDAVAVMARARFTLRAYLLDGNPPDLALAKCSAQFDISLDGHLATVLVGVGNSLTGEIVLANAGHPPPVLINPDGSAELVRVPVSPPLGTGRGRYQTTRLVVPVGATLVAYTDGLVERRGEDIEVSLERMVATASDLSTEVLAEFVPALLEAMQGDGEDDIAVLALGRRRLDPGS